MSVVLFHPPHFVFASLAILTCSTNIAHAQSDVPSRSSAPSTPDITTVYTAPVFTGSVVANDSVKINSSVNSNNSGNRLAKFASGTGAALFVGAGTLLPLLEDGPDGKNHALRTADSLLTSALITEALKRIVREERPDNSARDSFPSSHATAAFAVATMQSHYHPKQAPFWYAGAALISYSRVKLNRHHYHDVIAGAAVGYFTSRWQLSQSRGLILAPFLGSRKQGVSSGLSLSMNF